jgi:hypothetical protein
MLVVKLPSGEYVLRKSGASVQLNGPLVQVPAICWVSFASLGGAVVTPAGWLLQTKAMIKLHTVINVFMARK